MPLKAFISMAVIYWIYTVLYWKSHIGLIHWLKWIASFLTLQEKGFMRSSVTRPSIYMMNKIWIGKFMFWILRGHIFSWISPGQRIPWIFQRHFMSWIHHGHFTSKIGLLMYSEFHCYITFILQCFFFDCTCSWWYGLLFSKFATVFSVNWSTSRPKKLFAIFCGEALNGWNLPTQNIVRFLAQRDLIFPKIIVVLLNFLFYFQILHIDPLFFG